MPSQPRNHADLVKLEKGLNLLFQYDPAVEVGLESNGQHTISCLGELHLEQCIKFLTEKFARCVYLALY
jgi:ribosome assembly protein 1